MDLGCLPIKVVISEMPESLHPGVGCVGGICKSVYKGWEGATLGVKTGDIR